MTIRRQVFDIATNNPSAGDTGEPFTGEIKQVRWYPHIPSNNHSLKLSLLSQLGDTGQYGFEFVNATPGLLGGQFVIHPRHHPAKISGQADTGPGVPVIAENGYVRAKVADTGASSVAGRLEIWSR